MLSSKTLGVIAHAASMKFNQGGYLNPTSSVGSQFNEKFWSKVAVQAARRYMVFSQLGDQLIQPKNFGDTIVKYAEIPIIHQLNVNDQGIDANGAKLDSGKWYAYDATGAMIGSASGYADKYSAEAVVGCVTIKNGRGNMWGGDSDIAVIKGSFPALNEEGGKVNAVGMVRQVLTAKVSEFGFHVPFTQKMLDMDTEPTLLARISKEVGIAQGEIREKQIAVALLSASEVNRVIAGAASSISGMTSTDLVDFQDIRSMQQSLKLARVPKATKIIDGSSNYGTTVVGAGYAAYVGQELLPTLEDMTYGGVNVWKPVESYAAAGVLMEHEIGKISNTRFIEVMEMPKYAGQGATVGASDADKDNRYTSNGKYDVFPILYVGTDSFGTVGFEGDVARVNTIMPKADAYNDPFGKRGVVSISWYFGLLVYRPERIRQILSVSKIA